MAIGSQFVIPPASTKSLSRDGQLLPSEDLGSESLELLCSVPAVMIAIKAFEVYANALRGYFLVMEIYTIES